MAQRLEVFQSLWAMERRRPDGVEWDTQTKVAMIADAGFDGICIDLAGGDVPAAKEIAPLLAQHNLRVSINAFPSAIEDLDTVLAMAQDLRAALIVINARYFPFLVEKAVDFVRRALDRCATAGIESHFETHRATLTTDLLFTIQVLERVPKMKLVLDLSHYVVGRELIFPLDPFHVRLFDQLFERCTALQGRVGTREQIQVPLKFPQNRVWVERFEDWWLAAMKSWRRRHSSNAVLNFLCELGPPPYALTGADGYELSDRWIETLHLRDRIRQLWNTTCSEVFHDH